VNFAIFTKKAKTFEQFISLPKKAQKYLLWSFSSSLSED
jgi:hypothetical protein